MTVKMTKDQYNKKHPDFKGMWKGQPSILTMNQQGATVIETVVFI
jgi:hypothetical protein